MSRTDIEPIVQQLKSDIIQGRNWYLALLDAIRVWSATEEEHNGQHYRYLIDNEAFDWLVLAARLCEEVDGLIPEKELIDLIFFDRPPLELPKEDFKKLIGIPKYKAYLNYLYGVLVERFLILAITEEIRKEKRVLGLNSDDGVIDEAFRRIYGATQAALLRQFRKEKGHLHPKSMNLSELNEFTYWLFKYRVKTQEKSRVASDTKKALIKLHTLSTMKAKQGRR